MSKKSFFLIALSSLVLLAAVLFVVNINPAYCDTTAPAFYGITYVDGVATDNVSVSLVIGDKTYRTTSYTNSQGQHGTYTIGKSSDTGWYCLQAYYYLGQTEKGYGYWGTKSGNNSINQDLYLTGTWDSCPQHK